jgi:uncharacterized protein YcaQ
MARRLVIVRQHLAGPRGLPNLEAIMSVMQDIRYLQYDPMSIVAPSHFLVLWSRLGPYDPGLLDTLLWKERRLFEDWAQATSIVLSEDYSIFNALKQGFAGGDSSWAKKIRDWMKKNKSFSAYILEELERKGPLFSTQFEDRASEPWKSTGWTAGRNVDMMLFFLKAQGKIMLGGRAGNKRLWDLTEHFLPEWVHRERLSPHDVARRAAQLSLRGLGVAIARHIQQHFIRRCYGDLESALAELEAEEQVFHVEVQDGRKFWSGSWYIHSEDVHLLDSLEDDDWEPRTTLLSPFDNLISDRRRTEQLWGFRFRFEVYVPKPKREYGCYVMPILHGDRLIGRVDPVMNREAEQLTIKAVYAEPNVPKTAEAGQMIAKAVEDLAVFLGAEEIHYGSKVPAFWKRYLH